MRFVVTQAAARDIRDVLREALRTFGTHQLSRYAEIIDRGTDMVAADPGRPGSFDRSEIAPGVTLLHLEHAASRRGAAAPCLYYTTGRLSDGSIGTLILRLLHERMEPRYRVVRSLAASARQIKAQPDDLDEK